MMGVGTRVGVERPMWPGNVSGLCHHICLLFLRKEVQRACLACTLHGWDASLSTIYDVS